MPHRACAKCGYYKGREVIQVEEKSASTDLSFMPSTIALDAMGSDRAPKPETGGRSSGRAPLWRARAAGRTAGRIKADSTAIPAPPVFRSKWFTPAKSSPWTTKPRRPCAPSATRPFAWDAPGARWPRCRIRHRRQHRRSHGDRENRLGMLPGVNRPALAAVFPTVLGTVAESVGCRRQCRLRAAQSRAVRGHGRDVFPQHVRHEETARWDCSRSAKKNPRATN